MGLVRFGKAFFRSDFAHSPRFVCLKTRKTRLLVSSQSTMGILEVTI